MGKTETPGGYEAFSAEDKQLFYELMTHIDDSTEVWLEKYDDVASKTGSDLELIQVKSATSTQNNPLSNRSPELWKTLSNWINKLKSLEEDDEDINVLKCRYSVSSHYALSTGSFLYLFKQARSEDEAERAISQVVAEFTNPSDRIKMYFDNFIKKGNRQYALKVICLFDYEIHSGFHDELQGLFHRTSFVAKELEPKLFQMMCGWIKERIAKYTETNSPAVIQRLDYCDKLRSVSALRRENPLIVPLKEPTENEIEAEKDRKPNYLAQLQLIGINVNEESGEDGLRAVMEKLQSDSLVAELAKDGVISAEGFDFYRQDLVLDWNDVRQEKLLQISVDDVIVGRQIYFQTRQATKGTKLQSYDPPRFLTCGQLHALADEIDEELGVPRIGWHPHYADKFTTHNPNE